VNETIDYKKNSVEADVVPLVFGGNKTYSSYMECYNDKLKDQFKEYEK
jgi:hypothetical protein